MKSQYGRPFELFEKGYERGLKGTVEGLDIWLKSQGIDSAALSREMQSFAFSADLGKLQTPSYLVEQLSSLASTTLVTLSTSFRPETTSFTDKKTSVTLPSQAQTSWLYIVPFLVIVAMFATIILLRKKDQESRHSSEHR